MLGVSQSREAKERMDGGEPNVSSARTIAPIDFQVVQKRTHDFGIEIIKAERRGHFSALVLDEGEQDLEGVAVGIDRVGLTLR